MTTETTLRPGERLLSDGTVYVFNSTLRAEAVARENVAAALASDLSSATDQRLSGLMFDCIAVSATRRDTADANALGRAIGIERAARGIDSGGARAQ